jgi:hypothetical protein
VGVSGVGQFVEVDNSARKIGLVEQEADEITTNKAGAAGYQKGLEGSH